jgi:hypothetical protein
VAKAENELFYIVTYPSYAREYPNEDIVYAPAEGHILSLRGMISKERYQAMENVLNMNDCPLSDEFLLEYND